MSPAIFDQQLLFTVVELVPSADATLKKTVRISNMPCLKFQSISMPNSAEERIPPRCRPALIPPERSEAPMMMRSDEQSSFNRRYQPTVFHIAASSFFSCHLRLATLINIQPFGSACRCVTFLSLLSSSLLHHLSLVFRIGLDDWVLFFGVCLYSRYSGRRS